MARLTNQEIKYIPFWERGKGLTEPSESLLRPLEVDFSILAFT